MKKIILFFLILIGYYLTAKLGLAIPYIGTQITLIWLPTGIALAGLYRIGNKLLPSVFLAAFVVNFEISSDIWLSLGIALGNTLSPYIASKLLRHYKFDYQFRKRKDLYLYLAIGTISMSISASNGVVWLYMKDLLGAVPFENSWLIWWLGDSIGVLLAGIPLISFSRSNWVSDFKYLKGIESIVATIFLLFTGVGLFGIHPYISPFFPSIVILPFFFLIWVSLNASVTYSSFAALALSGFAIFATVNKTGPFTNPTDSYHAIFVLWSYICFIMLITVFVNILTIEIKENNSILEILNNRTPGVLLRIVKDEEGFHFHFLSKNTKEVLGIEYTEYKHNRESFLYRIHREDVTAFLSMLQLSAKRLEPIQLEVRIQVNADQSKWIQIDAVPELQEELTIVWNGFILDVTERKNSEKQILENEENLRGLFTLSPVGIALLDIQGNILEMNEAAQDIFWKDKPVYEEKSFWELANVDSELLQAHILPEIGRINKFNSIETTVLSSHRKKIFIKFRGILVKRNSKEFLWILIENITSFKEYKDKLEFMALYDSLTGLPNRSLLTQKIEKMLHKEKKENLFFALCYLDLDEFKPINDSFGPEFGDELLKRVATRLYIFTGEDGFIGRIGGDEFVIVLDKLSDKKYLFEKLNSILDVLSQPFQMRDSIDISVYASIGVTIFPEDDSNADSLLRHADLALYESKQKGKNTYHIFDPQTEKNYKEKQKKFFEIREAFEKEQFELFFQPIIDLENWKVAGAESLLRWRHPKKGIIPPSEFIPIIENTDLTIPMGEWIVKSACHSIRNWRKQGKEIAVSINLFSKHLQSPGFLEFFLNFFATQKDISAGLLKLEILETTAMEDMENVTHILQECKKIGLEIVLDDFGTAYSSLTYLKRLPTNSIKIDQSFIRQMLEEKEDLAIVKGIIGLAREFQRTVVAEGVETSEQIKTLFELGCQYGQGYYFSRPIPEKEFINWALNFDRRLISS